MLPSTTLLPLLTLVASVLSAPVARPGADMIHPVRGAAIMKDHVWRGRAAPNIKVKIDDDDVGKVLRRKAPIIDVAIADPGNVNGAA